ncbi:hypothetical protein V4S31_10150 [Enterococcus cecorum]|uniref:hypothetical protein n=2 Tax=Lactobacillales TaxID=186826 RepID=UPI00200A80D5|nr:hypothetical protein [Enterococcus cecorum]
MKGCKYTNVKMITKIADDKHRMNMYNGFVDMQIKNFAKGLLASTDWISASKKNKEVGNRNLARKFVLSSMIWSCVISQIRKIPKNITKNCHKNETDSWSVVIKRIN